MSHVCQLYACMETRNVHGLQSHDSLLVHCPHRPNVLLLDPLSQQSGVDRSARLLNRSEESLQGQQQRYRGTHVWRLISDARATHWPHPQHMQTTDAWLQHTPPHARKHQPCRVSLSFVMKTGAGGHTSTCRTSAPLGSQRCLR